MKLQDYLIREMSCSNPCEENKLKSDGVLATPAYYFDADAFANRVRQVKDAVGDSIPVCYAMKANPFLLSCLPDEVAKVEVCSPGELTICQRLGIAPERIIYSGVMKEKVDIRRAMEYGVAIMTAESKLHATLENEVGLELRARACAKLGACACAGRTAGGANVDDSKTKSTVNGMNSDAAKTGNAALARQKVILRLTSGNQFGMSEEDIEDIISHASDYPTLDFYGIHYYSGTQKKRNSAVEKDLLHLQKFLERLENEYGYEARLVEYGPGISVDYFNPPYEEKDMETLADAAESLRGFATCFPLAIEMGRFLAAPCGSYVTRVKDLKYSSETNYVICDGGMHHLKYYGQTMAMQVPPIEVIAYENCGDGCESKNCCGGDGAEAKIGCGCSDEADACTKPYAVCGSLCTVADVLVREVELPELHIGDSLVFGLCGAYSVTEGSLLFLSRVMPRVYIYRENTGADLAREFIPADILNTAGLLIGDNANALCSMKVNEDSSVCAGNDMEVHS